MNKIKKSKLLILLTLIIFSCDIPGKVEIKNNLNELAIVSYSYKDNIKGYLPQINKINPNEKGYIILGFGTKWNESFINNFPNEVIDTINLKIGNNEFYCCSKECKSKIFNIANRKSKNTMRIVIDSNLIQKVFLKK